MSTSTKVSAGDHAMHTAYTCINDVVRKLDIEDREFVYHAAGVAAHPARSANGEAVPTLQHSCPS